ncbi:MAG: Fis family transcriptional regulator [Ignavibacteriae bacterium]|nr:MAG: Fis family transcriptional regulator [Ignavibacteriota bacterium]
MEIKILIADDEKGIRDSLKMILDEEGYETTAVENGDEALALIERNEYHLVISDIKMPGLNGIQLLEKGSKISPDTYFIIMTAYASVETAVEALRNGAYDYLLKPVEFDDLLIRVKRLLEFRKLAEENKFLRKKITGSADFNNIIGQSESIKKIFDIIKQVAPTNSNVLISGKSGTGKELVAKSIHYNSLRKDKIFLPINCGAISATLIESELFGHKKGSFTGAINDKDGLFKVADRGTLFLDEIGDLPLNLQVKLLRVIEDREFIPVGGVKPIKTDVRIIAATHHDIYEKTKIGEFREDLYYRLNVVEIKLPSLNERREDIPLLVNHFVTKYCNEMGKPVLGVNNESMKKLINYNWRGGVRELENIIERAIIFSKSDIIQLDDITDSDNISVNLSDVPEALKEATMNFEKNHIKRIIKKYDNNKEEAAKALNIGLSSLYRKMELMGISTKTENKN